ncbi:hypothetical protein PAXRUDRAFT_173851 [Paxillus rubicundulus Ve08.2h10]|uniref:DUF6589 domain-containing protein n=1 Tax=Paxillus rubicundulus Ve08.2h10 TaxID=930991 RepID=A0A0D0D4Z9_9AGAM|nr:hypothetical protein PAXRUDRAFT_173851 [Paxillus rubicundulus Ve08.2h10]
MLVNPNGKALKWRAVDWCIELNNLFTKVKNGGKGSNRTVERILLKSPLVQVYCNIQGTIQKNFDHSHLTMKHGDLNMKKTFDKLLEKFVLNSPHVVSVGRKSRHEIMDLNDKGREMMERAETAQGEGGEGRDKGGDKGEDRALLEDVVVELL